MVTENIDLIKSLVKNKNPMYGILSFTSDTFETIKSNVYETDMSDDDRIIFENAMKSIIKGMYELDSLFDRII